MRILHLLLIASLLQYGLWAHADKEGEDSTEKKHHYGKRIKELQIELADLKVGLEKDELRIKQLEDNLRATDANELKEMRERVSKHDLYFGILTAITGIMAVAIVGELIKRWIPGKS